MELTGCSESRPNKYCVPAASILRKPESAPSATISEPTGRRVSSAERTAATRNRHKRFDKDELLAVFGLAKGGCPELFHGDYVGDEGF